MMTYYETERLILRLLTPDYAPEVLRFYMNNKELFEKYEPARPENFYTEAYQRTVLTYEYNAFIKETSVRLWVYKKDDSDSVIGTVSFTHILPSVFSSCTIGYKFDRSSHHHGYALEALKKVIEIIFYEFCLHRITAYIMPDNIPSKKLVEKIGFTYEGTARKSILINDRWEDHEQYSLIYE